MDGGDAAGLEEPGAGPEAEAEVRRRHLGRHHREEAARQERQADPGPKDPADARLWRGAEVPTLHTAAAAAAAAASIVAAMRDAVNKGSRHHHVRPNLAKHLAKRLKRRALL